MKTKSLRAASLFLLFSMALASCGAEVEQTPEAVPENNVPAIEAAAVIPETAESVESPEPVLQAESPAEAKPEEHLSDPQRNSLAMLNYLASLTQEINTAPNNRVFLEDAYSEILNNTNPEVVDEATKDYLASLLDTIESYRMISVKRDRLLFVYEQMKAQMIINMIPNPDILLEFVPAPNPKKVAEVAAVFVNTSSTVLGSLSSAADFILSTDYMQQGWELDDEESATLHESRKQGFLYMIDIVRDNDLPSGLALTENDISQFVSWKYNGNVKQRLQFLESSEDIYAGFGEYWLERAKCCNETGNYQQCLDCMDRYTEVQCGIFRKDHNLAEAVPSAVASAAILYESSPATYEAVVSDWLQILMDNTSQTDWDLRYFAAQAYADLYAKTMSDEYLSQAYAITLDNVNQLIAGQKSLNTAYLSAVKEITVSDMLSKDEQKKIKDYNKSLSDHRKTELPPVYTPLSLNCDLLFAIAEKMDLSAEEKNRITGLLHSGNERLFLDETVDNLYRFDRKSVSISAGLTKSELTLPVNCLSDGAVINMKVIDNNTSFTYNDWTVKSVSREGTSVSSYTAVFTSEKFKKHAWSPDAKISITVTKPGVSGGAPVALSFKVSSYKKILVSSLVEFEQVG